MFFIYILIAAAALIAAVLFLKTKFEINVDQNNITLNIFFVGFIKITKKYIIKYDDETILALFFKKGDKLKKISTLKDVVLKLSKSEPAEITFINLLNIIIQSSKKKRKIGIFSYLYRKANYKLKINLQLGVSDAYMTAILCGLLKTAYSTLFFRLNSGKNKTGLSIKPEFSKQVISVKIACIISIFTADIIIGYFIYLKNKRR